MCVSKASWEALWSAGVPKGACWDAARAEPALLNLMKRAPLPAGRALIPGCGRGYAVAALASADRLALGLDISPTGVAVARQYLKEALGGSALEKQARIEERDFFSLDAASVGGQFNLIYDCTFLCAIPPDLRPAWAKQMGRLVAPSGELVTLISCFLPAGWLVSFFWLGSLCCYVIKLLLFAFCF
eukprot:TRINITY_DN15994_c0_g1_i2.p1 TRINITY_DN15994_c0_g1~~TRINITY_DN15994_c0_g1_i2.p1  ORF type:complete len:186 (+),score=6.94 TRINITY_DN15994_c0_g1_i2:170-727(+)